VPNQPVNPPAELLPTLESLRAVYSDALKQHLGKQQTAGTCLYAAILVETAVRQWLPRLEAVIRGGDGYEDGGYFSAAGKGHGHYWVEVDDGRRTWLADISGDQFGRPPVQLLLLSDVRTQYVAGTQRTVDQHVSEMLEEIDSANAVALKDMQSQ